MNELDYRVAIEALENHVAQTRPIYETSKAIDYLKKAHKEALAQSEQEPVAWPEEHLKFLNFLYGAGEFEGVWFEQKHQTEKGTFWWRKHLRRLFDAPPPPKEPEQKTFGYTLEETMKCWDLGYAASVKALAQEKALQALHDENERLGLYKDAYAEPEEEKLHPVHIGVDVTREGTAVTAFYRKPDAVMEMFYSQFHPLARPEQEPVAWTRKQFGEDREYCEKPFTTDWTPLYTTPPQPKEPEQSTTCGEPVAWMYESVCGNDFATRHKPPDYGKNIRPLYTSPQLGLAWTQQHWTEYEHNIAAAEREAIIDLVAMYGGPVDLEAAIRARGKA